MQLGVNHLGNTISTHFHLDRVNLHFILYFRTLFLDSPFTGPIEK